MVLCAQLGEATAALGRLLGGNDAFAEEDSLAVALHLSKWSPQAVEDPEG